MTLPFSQERCKDQIAYDLVLKKFIQYIESEQAEKNCKQFCFFIYVLLSKSLQTLREVN